MRHRGSLTSGELSTLHRCFPRSPFPACGYGQIPGRRRPHGEIGGGRERPPLFAARIGSGGVAQFTFAPHPLGGAPVPIILAGRPGGRPWTGWWTCPPRPPCGARTPHAAHIAASEPDARSGGASPPEPRMRRDTYQPNNSPMRDRVSSERASSKRVATDLPSPQPHPCNLLSSLDRQNRG